MCSPSTFSLMSLSTSSSPIVADSLPSSREDELERWGERHPTSILCWIPMGRLNDKRRTRIVLIESTYGAYCDVGPIFVFWEKEISPRQIAELNDLGIKTQTLNNSENVGGTLWDKSRTMWMTLGASDYTSDWYIRLDDDNFFSPVNARGWLQYYSSSVSHYLGLPMYNIWKWPHSVFNSGGCIILSQTTLDIFTAKADSVFDTSPFCRKHKPTGHGEDAELSYCLKLMDIYSEDTRDAKGIHRIGAHFRSNYSISDPLFDTYRHNNTNQPGPYQKNRPVQDSEGCCSEYLVSYHRPYKGKNEPHESNEWMLLHLQHNINGLSLDSFPVPPEPQFFPRDPAPPTRK